ncbi:sigma factor [Nonomuraea sp. NPDC052265]|uniref:sigma factor n=1 Tax=Nonomuraea sp. NPDC052265 TaxID=3364374 RepID=UPI0037CC7DEB
MNDLEAVFRAEWGTVVATLIRLTGDWDLAEECAQDAFAAALERRPRDGVPDRPGAWLTTTARNRALDRLRRERAGAVELRQAALAAQAGPPPADDFPAAALDLRAAGPYQVQTAIAACHATATEAAATDWPQIVLLYGRLTRLLPSPVVELNRAVAVAMARGPAAGLELVDRLAATGELGDYHLLHAARADLLRRLDRRDEAAVVYRRALGLAPAEAERRYLARRLAEVGGVGA